MENFIGVSILFLCHFYRIIVLTASDINYRHFHQNRQDQFIVLEHLKIIGRLDFLNKIKLSIL